ncbi:GNAT family N-acetyltransferase [Kocuria sp. ZOR0020]|uniref:GNAT family N-acetyltransferase n=1 Tax=Kocuria sp. ZOR0020 TaxID=1339234 RepID=UPI0009DDD9F5|nr:GNAT family N-acetyltransferase [Kocuria sp. ZOR0020]
MVLNWREARADDRESLKDFICTDPPKVEYNYRLRRKFHPRQYELDVQSLFRNVRIPLTEENALLLLGFAATNDPHQETLRAAVYYAYGEVSLGDERLPAYEIRAIAVGQEHQGKGLGREALVCALESAQATTQLNGLNDDEIVVMAQIHIDNEPSQHLFQSFGFSKVDLMSECVSLWSAPSVSIALQAAHGNL